MIKNSNLFKPLCMVLEIYSEHSAGVSWFEYGSFSSDLVLYIVVKASSFADTTAKKDSVGLWSAITFCVLRSKTCLQMFCLHMTTATVTKCCIIAG